MDRKLGQRYGWIPWGQRPCVYVAELRNGVIKVGRTAIPFARMTNLNAYVRQHFGCDLDRIHIEDCNGRGTMERAERRLIRAMCGVGMRLPNRREFFAGVSFDAAVALINAEGAPAVPVEAVT